jgi:hypothetical protein
MSVLQGSHDDDRQLEHYLLGLLSEEETQRVDELSIVDGGVAWRLRAVENDLVDAYVRGELAEDSMRLFAAHYLLSPRRREKVLFAERFVRAVDAAAARTVPVRSPPASRWKFAAVAAGLLIVVCGALAVRDMRLGRALQEAEIQRVALERRAQALEQHLHEQRSATASTVEELARVRASQADRAASSRARSGPPAPAQAPAARTTVALVLFPLTRSAGIAPAVSVPADADRVAFELRLEVPDFPRYAATLNDPATHRIVWRSGTRTATSAGDRPAVSIAVPASVLKSQTYAFELTGVPASGDAEVVGNYVFRIVRP